MVLVFRGHDDPCPGRGSSCMMCVDIRDDDIGTLRYSRIFIAEWRLQLSKFIVTGRAKHDHSVSEDQLRVSYSVIAHWYHQVPLEIERRAQPLNCRGSIPVSKCRDNVCCCSICVAVQPYLQKNVLHPDLSIERQPVACRCSSPRQSRDGGSFSLHFPHEWQHGFLSTGYIGNAIRIDCANRKSPL